MIVLKNVCLWIIGAVLIAGFMVALRKIDPALKNDSIIVMTLSFAWGAYVFAKNEIELKQSKN